MAHDSSSTSLATHEKLPIVTALVGVTLIAWIYLFRLAGEMENMGAAEMMQLQPWSVSDFILMFFMWAVMMVGMMVPAAPAATGDLGSGAAAELAAADNQRLIQQPAGLEIRNERGHRLVDFPGM